MKKILKPTPDEYYVNEDGYRVFKEAYHLRRGYCCKSGCKHCPYGYDKKTDSFKKVWLFSEKSILTINKVLKWLKE